MFVEGVCDLPPVDEDDNNCVLVTIVYHDHLTLKVVDVVLQTLHGFHLDCEEVIVSLEFSSRSKLVIECVGHVMKAL